MTSVKDFRIDESAGDTELGRGAFLFSDRYSVFDWGEMPDHLDGKGSSLCVMGAYHFERLDEAGIPNHYRGVLSDEQLTDLNQLETPPDSMAIELTQVPDLPFVNGDYDYETFFESGGDNYLIPLEIVFRNFVPPGSSLRDRKSPSDVGLEGDEWPSGSVELSEPVVEFSTKYEEQDRYLTEEEADRIAGKASLRELRSIAESVNEVINQQARSSGFRHEDGKIECLYFDGEIKVADVVGTFDENRFSVDDFSISKEFLREYYRTSQPEWYEAIKSAKAQARSSDDPDWKRHCDVEPEPLPVELKQTASNLYRAGTNAYTGRKWFEVPSLDEVLQQLKQFT